MTTDDIGQGAIGRWTRRIYAGVLLLVGVALAVGGGVLAWLGGSLYYVVTGLTVVISGVLVWRSDRRGAWLYGAMLVSTLAWAVWEVGFEPWLLMPRLVAPLVLGLGLLLPPIRRLPVHAPVARIGGWPAFATGMVAALLAGAGLHAAQQADPADPLWQTGPMVQAPQPLPQPMATVSATEWPAFGNDQGGTRFSPLTQITPQNVATLTQAWEAETGPALPGPTGGLEVSPIMIDGSLYVCSGYNNVIAFDAENGHERWRYDMTGTDRRTGKPCRGVTYYKVPGATGDCAERIFAATQGNDLLALDARTGRPCAGFGTAGRTSFLTGMGQVPFGILYVSSAPQLVRGKIVVGGGIIDGQAWDGPSGVIRAFDAITGQLAWAYDVGHPDRHGLPPAGEEYTRSTPNSWAPISADEKLGLVYLPTGNATPDAYAAQRRPFDDEISSSVIALDADTGTLRWKFQAVHHDIWDYDMPAQPTLVDMPTPQGMRPALIQPTKQGDVYVLDRETGQPIKPVEERPVPQDGAAPGERLSSTQPFSVGMPRFSGPLLREVDMWGTTPIDQMLCRIQFRQAHAEGTYTPISLHHPTLTTPGTGGGVDWGSVSVDVNRGIMVVNWMRLPGRQELITRAEAVARGYKTFDGLGPVAAPELPMEKTPYAAEGGGPFLSPLGAPCTAPPWGLLSAVNLVTGRVIWNKPLGTAYDTGLFGIKSHLPFTIGAPLSGGSISTGSGLVFVAATAEDAIRAIDVTNGAELWKARLPGGGQATPMTYQSRSGKQFVLIAAGGKPSLKSTPGTKIVAYSLP